MLTQGSSPFPVTQKKELSSGELYFILPTLPPLNSEFHLEFGSGTIVFFILKVLFLFSKMFDVKLLNDIGTKRKKATTDKLTVCKRIIWFGFEIKKESSTTEKNNVK